jgi:hypothetical protein
VAAVPYAALSVAFLFVPTDPYSSVRMGEMKIGLNRNITLPQIFTGL